jgi:hypothetical protein
MILDLSKQFDIERAKTYFNKLIEKRVKIELCEKREKRTINQNSLCHLWYRVFADHIGELSYENCKRDVKRYLLGTIERVNRFTGEVMFEDYRTSAMDTKELSEFMNKFKIFAQTEFGCYLPYFDDVGYEELIEMYYK